MKLWPFWPQVQMCLTSERDSVFLSSWCKAEDRRLIHWFLAGIVKSVHKDKCISFIPPHSEILNRCYVVDVTCEVIFLHFCHHTIGASAGADTNGFWECWRKSRGYTDTVMIILFCSVQK